MALSSGLVADEKSVEAERDRFLKKFNGYKIENKQILKLILEKDAAMMAMSTRLPCVVKK